jgi:hypothetical protein
MAPERLWALPANSDTIKTPGPSRRATGLFCTAMYLGRKERERERRERERERERER